MKNIDNHLFSITSKELRTMSASDFNNGSVLHVKPREGSDFKYIITLKKKVYKSFSMESTVECAETYKYLTTPGSSKGMRPYFIDEFLSR